MTRARTTTSAVTPTATAAMTPVRATETGPAPMRRGGMATPISTPIIGSSGTREPKRAEGPLPERSAWLDGPAEAGPGVGESWGKRARSGAVSRPRYWE